MCLGEMNINGRAFQENNLYNSLTCGIPIFFVFSANIVHTIRNESPVSKIAQ